ncbi:MAG: Crp/Fnr family transcriptional regulator, partial [Ornithinibacter sp.]
ALTAAELETLLREQPDLAIAELRRLSRQLRTLTDRFTLRNEDLRSRLVGFLTTHLDETGEHTLRLTRQELADWIGVTREAATRMLRQLEEQGLITLGRGSVTILDPVGLSRLAGA